MGRVPSQPAVGRCYLGQVGHPAWTELAAHQVRRAADPGRAP